MTEQETNRERLLEGLRHTVTEVMHTMAWSNVALSGEESVPEFALSDEMGGLIRLSGSHTGMIGISSGSKLAREVVARIIGLDAAELEPDDLLDGVGELTNMICGGMKTKAQMADLVLSTPLAVVGTDYKALWKTDRPITVITFQIEECLFRVHASI